MLQLSNKNMTNYVTSNAILADSPFIIANITLYEATHSKKYHQKQQQHKKNDNLTQESINVMFESILNSIGHQLSNGEEAQKE